MNNFLTWWAASLSTILGVIKIYEFYQERTKIEVGWDWKPADHGGNVITLYNSGNKPVMVKQWLLIRKRTFQLKHTTIEGSYDMNSGDIAIPAHSKVDLTFVGENYFSTHIKEKNEYGGLYILLYVAGRTRPITKFVY